MKTQKGYFDFMLFWMRCVLSRVDETVSGEAPQRNYHTWGAAGVWTRTRNTDGSVRAYGNPLTLPFTDCGPRDIAVHKGANHGQETVLNSVTLMLGLMWVSSRSPVCPNSSYRTYTSCIKHIQLFYQSENHELWVWSNNTHVRERLWLTAVLHLEPFGPYCMSENCISSWTFQNRAWERCTKDFKEGNVWNQPRDLSTVISQMLFLCLHRREMSIFSYVTVLLIS